MQATYVLFPRQGEVTVETEEIDARNPAPREALLRTEAGIISAGTELATLHNTQGNVIFPIRPGYGCIGRVEAKGDGLDEFSIGQRVFYAGKHASLQKFTHGQGHQWGTIYPAPESLNAQEAVFACMAQIAFIAPQVTRFSPGDTVAVFGLGLVGNLAAQLYRRGGARVIGLDPMPQRGEIARRTGIEEIVTTPATEQIEAVFDLTNGRGADVTVDAAGHAAVILNCVMATARFGQVVLLGTPRTSHQADITPALYRVHNEGIVMRGAHMWRLPPQPTPTSPQSVAQSLEKVFGFIGSGDLRVRELLSHTVSAAQAPQIYGNLRRHPEEFMGTVFDWNR